MSHQELPKPPVPPLGPTLQRYLDGVRAVVLDANQLAATESLVAEFGNPGGSGARLQALLEQHAADSDSNWVTPLWLEDMYLRNPLPLPVNSNPFFLLPKQRFHNQEDQIRFAARLARFSFLFKNKIHRDGLPPDSASGHGKGAPLCMKTYQHFFTACRLPGIPADCLEIQPAPADHFIVAYRSQFFVVECPNSAEEIPTEDALCKCFQAILHSVTEPPTELPVGVLTSENRRVWARLREELLQDPGNERNLKSIESSLWILCLDPPLPGMPSYATIRKESITLDVAAMAAHILHGSGTDSASTNRWYDKFLQLIVTLDGVCGVLVEHSASEGVTVLRYCQELLDHLEKDETNVSGRDAPLSWRPLCWTLTPEVAQVISTASCKLDKLVSDLDLYVLRFSEYGKDFVKSQKMSPDVYVQLALQLTYFKVHKRLTATYESASLRQFREGRVDNIRAATPEALRWVRAMCDITEEDKLELFREAVRKQTDVLLYTIKGHGPDNHLLGLREMARRHDLPDPAIFTDKSYKEFMDFRLSTSQLATETGTLVGYGPVVPDGYGCSYTIMPGYMVFCVSSFFSSAETSSDFFALSLEGSLLQMRELLL